MKEPRLASSSHWITSGLPLHLHCLACRGLIILCPFLRWVSPSFPPWLLVEPTTVTFGPPGFVKPPLLGLNPGNPYTFSNLFLWLLGVSAQRTLVMLFHHPAFIDCSLVTPSSGQLRAKRPKTNQTKTSISPPTNNHPNLKVDRKSYSYRDPSHCRPPPLIGACKVLRCSLPSLSTLLIDFNYKDSLAELTCLRSLPL